MRNGSMSVALFIVGLLSTNTIDLSSLKNTYGMSGISVSQLVIYWQIFFSIWSSILTKLLSSFTILTFKSFVIQTGTAVGICAILLAVLLFYNFVANLSTMVNSTFTVFFFRYFNN